MTNPGQLTAMGTLELPAVESEQPTVEQGLQAVTPNPGQPTAMGTSESGPPTVEQGLQAVMTNPGQLTAMGTPESGSPAVESGQLAVEQGLQAVMTNPGQLTAMGTPEPGPLAAAQQGQPISEIGGQTVVNAATQPGQMGQTFLQGATKRVTKDGLIYAIDEERNEAEVVGFDPNSYLESLEGSDDGSSGRWIVIPSHIEGAKVLYIGTNAFAGQDAVESVLCSPTVVAIGAGAFCGCANLARMYWNGTPGVLSIEKEAFKNCERFRLLAIPQSVKEIGPRAFWGCEGLKHILLEINKGMKIARGAFPDGIPLQSTFNESPEIPAVGGEQANPTLDEQTHSPLESATQEQMHSPLESSYAGAFTNEPAS
jgi:hypothetical protein